jgi:hypothetical protein
MIMNRISSIALAAAFGLAFAASAHAQSAGANIVPDYYGAAHNDRVVTGRSVAVPNDQSRQVRRSNDSADAIGAFSFGAF